MYKENKMGPHTDPCVYYIYYSLLLSLGEIWFNKNIGVLILSILFKFVLQYSMFYGTESFSGIYKYADTIFSFI